MADERVKAHLREFGFEGRMIDFEQSTATVDEAAAAVGCEPCRIAKTLAFRTDDGAILIVAAGDARVDNRKFKATFGTKARMISPDETEDLIGFAPGGVCPFAAKDGVRVCLDESLRRFDSVYPACGTPNSAVRLSVSELEKCLPGSQFVDVCKNWQEAQN